MMSLKHKIAYNTVVQFGGRFLTSFLGFLTTVILARYLGATDYGVYAKIYTLAAFFFLFIDFGLNAVYIRRYKEDLGRFPLLTVTRLMFFFVSLSMITLFLLATNRTVFSPREEVWVFLFSPTILFFGLLTSFNVVFQLKLRYDLSVTASVIGGTLGLVLLALFIRLGLSWAILALVTGYMVTVLFAYLFAKRIGRFPLLERGISWADIWGFLREAAPLGAMLFLNTMYSRVDVFILAAIKGDAAVGVYQLAYKFFEFPLAFATFFANAVFPHYVRILAEDRERFARIFAKGTRYLFLSAFIFTLGGLVIAPYLRWIRQDYLLSTRPLQILVLSYPVFFLTSALSWFLFLHKREKVLIWVYGLSFLLNATLNFILVPRHSFIASSWITVFGEALVFLLLLSVALPIIRRKR